MSYSNHIEISKSALEQNINFIRQQLLRHTRLSCVVKGNAYGHGIPIIIPLEEDMGINHFSVFNAEEAYQVKQVSKRNSTIMIMGMLTQEQVHWAVEQEVEFYIFERERLQEAEEAAKKIGKPALIHLEVETGMNRTGVPFELLEEFVLKIDRSPHLQLKGVCTHLAGAESISNYYRVKKQTITYQKILRKLQGMGITPQNRHIASSAATLRHPNTQMDMVRVGILQYGFFPNEETFTHYITKKTDYDYPLKRIISWKSQVMSLKDIQQGEFVGYGTSYFAHSPMTIATVPVGYGHGYSRSLSNQGRVIINGHFAPVVGTINMNMICVDVSNIPNIQKGDEVVLIGKQDELEISVASFSDFSNQINYELLTRLPIDIPRIVVE
ncbi:alanine racemase [Algivirga pacifica]|uniref:Alanine racemase n=1 Tax=Algivirga pacifica TaxID=1162670 RepID=A0ABP9DK12_9BACT